MKPFLRLQKAQQRDASSLPRGAAVDSVTTPSFTYRLSGTPWPKSAMKNDGPTTTEEAPFAPYYKTAGPSTSLRSGRDDKSRGVESHGELLLIKTRNP